MDLNKVTMNLGMELRVSLTFAWLEHLFESCVGITELLDDFTGDLI